MVEPKLSVVLCTYNPLESMLRLCLGSLAKQDLPRSEYELIVVDNNSSVPLEKAKLESYAEGDVVLVRETRPGLVHARVAGFAAAKHDVFVFIDDDNEFLPNYLTNARRIAAAEPALGVFGGRCIGAFVCEPPPIKDFFLPFLGVREVGDEPLTDTGEEWGPHEPIGAGIVVRRQVADMYSQFVTKNAASSGLGRTGAQLLAGEDSLLSRFSHQAGLVCGYRPQLELRHHIAPQRLEWRYLSRLMKGHGTSFVRLARINGRQFDAVEKATVREAIVKNFMWRIRKEGLVAAVAHVFWDLGYYEAINGDEQT